MGVEDPVSMMFLAKMIGTCIAVFFGICFFIGLFYGEEAGITPLKIPETVDIGYINDYRYVTAKPIDYEKVEIQKLKHKVERMRLEKQLRDLQKEKAEKKKKKRCEQNPLMKECVDVLISVGEKKSEAIEKVNKYFKDNPNTKNINDFILGIFKK